MKILEVKNNLVKISYTAQDNLVLSGFVIIEDSQMPYVAQVMSLKADSGFNYAIVKLLFTFDEEGVVKNYSGTVPSMDAYITKLSAEELLDILPVENPLTIGKLAQRDFVLNIDYSALEKNLLVCSDNNENTDLLLSNFAKQITENNDKSVIFDSLGTVQAENKLVFGKDFKLPLNYDTINYIYEHDLGDIDPTSKAIIQDILLEVQEYSKTVLDKFIPFDSFISVVDSQYKISQIPELALLKNRLLKYKEQNVFAQDAKDIHSLRGTIRANLSTTIDMSSVDFKLQKLIISTVYDEINNMDLFVYSMVKINDDNADKKILRTFINQNKIFTSVFASHNYKYLHELKERASNIVLFAPISAQHDFASYNVYLGKLNAGEFVIEGKATQNIPLILELLPIEELREQLQKYEEELTTQKVSSNQELKVEDTQKEDSFDETSNTFAEDSSIVASKIETNVEAEDDFPSNDKINDSDSQEFSENTEEVISQENADSQAETEIIDDANAENEVQENVEQFEEVPSAEGLSDENLSETNNDLQQNNLLEEAPDEEEIIPQVKEMSLEEAGFTEAPIQEDDFPAPAQVENNSQESLTEDDLDMIDNVNNIQEAPFETAEQESLSDEFLDSSQNEIPTDDNISDNQEVVEQQESQFESFMEDVDEFSNEEINEVETQPDENDEYSESEGNILNEEQPPVVPVYPAMEETPVVGNSVEFNPGDRVAHPKYGEGVVEKMVKFGNKVLCAINFANGRRLLDPTISQIQKL